ncbi:MAG: response regulator [Gemmatimonadota bacterium]|nr:response regulator [Gemmatimonadota bacterium]MDH3423883.1 response regulator [Gemmatimonadota bacterium]
MTTDTPQSFRVLYVEDAFDQALLVKAFFQALPGFTVVHVQDGDQAIAKIENEPWDFLVTDLNLPGADGFTIIRHTRSLLPKLPILVTTGYTQAHYEEQALRAGADQVMIKPLTQNDFVSRIWAMLEQEEVFESTDESKVVLALEGRLGDAEMGCGGSMMRAIENGARVVIVPIIMQADDASQAELKAASLSSETLGVELRVDRTQFGDLAGQKDLLERTLNELRPSTLYLPAPDDRDPSRREASQLGRAAAVEVENVFGYETATTGLDFTPSHFIDVRAQMVMKMEALAAYQSVGSARVDLRPRMAQAYARYWGRFRDFNEVEAFERVESELG